MMYHHVYKDWRWLYDCCGPRLCRPQTRWHYHSFTSLKFPLTCSQYLSKKHIKNYNQLRIGKKKLNDKLLVTERRLESFKMWEFIQNKMYLIKQNHSHLFLHREILNVFTFQRTLFTDWIHKFINSTSVNVLLKSLTSDQYFIFLWILSQEQMEESV